MSLRSGSRASLRSEAQMAKVTRAASAKSFGTQRPPVRQFQRLESAKVQSDNKNAVVITIDDLERIKL